MALSIITLALAYSAYNCTENGGSDCHPDNRYTYTEWAQKLQEDLIGDNS